MCASAGIPILPEDADFDDDEEMEVSDYYSEIDYQAMLDNDAAPPKFPENEEWPTITGGLPLMERFPQLLSGGEDNECDLDYRVMDHWTSKEDGSSDLDRQGHNIAKEIPERKRVFELVNRDETGSERGRPATELLRSESRWECLSRKFGVGSVVAGSGDSSDG